MKGTLGNSHEIQVRVDHGGEVQLDTRSHTAGSNSSERPNLQGFLRNPAIVEYSFQSSRLSILFSASDAAEPACTRRR